MGFWATLHSPLVGWASPELLKEEGNLSDKTAKPCSNSNSHWRELEIRWSESLAPEQEDTGDKWKGEKVWRDWICEFATCYFCCDEFLCSRRLNQDCFSSFPTAGYWWWDDMWLTLTLQYYSNSPCQIFTWSEELQYFSDITGIL